MQLLSAEQRHVAEQLSQISLRRERLQSDKNALQIPDGQLLSGVQSNLAIARAQAEEEAAALAQLQEDLPEQEAQRNQLQQVLDRFVTTESGRPMRLIHMGDIPADPSVRDAVMRRQLLLLQTPGCPAALAIAQLANKIETTLLTPAP